MRRLYDSTKYHSTPLTSTSNPEPQRRYGPPVPRVIDIGGIGSRKT